MRALELTGGPARRLALRRGPAAIGCRSGERGDNEFGALDSFRIRDLLGPLPADSAVPEAAVATTRARVGELSAADDATGRLCLVLRSSAGPQGRCGVLTADRQDLLLTVGGDASRTRVGIATRTSAVRARITFSDGRRDSVRLTTATRYDGAYAGQVRFGVLRTPTPGADVVAIETLRADGDQLLDLELVRSLGTARLVASLPGGARVWFQRVRLLASLTVGCLNVQPTRPGDAVACLAVTSTLLENGATGAARVACGAAGTVAVGQVPRSARQVTAVLVGGGRIVARRFDAGSRALAGWVVRVPRGQTLLAVEVRSRTGRRSRLLTGQTRRSRQCGFDAVLGPGR